MISVRAGLFLGTVADLSDSERLNEAGITHVLTVDSEEPSPLPGLRHKFVFALDEAGTDLLSALDDCVDFIQNALATGRAAVLVHCHAGVSRCAAVVTAYLMKKEQLAFQDAYNKVQSVKPDVKVNDEFVRQLELYEAMGCEVDRTSIAYKQYRLQKVTEKYPELQNLPPEVFAADPTAGNQVQTSEALYRCRKCRRSLFRGSSILSHTFGTGPVAFAHKRMVPQVSGGDNKKCTSYFIEPVQWMEPALIGVMDGQLLCPKCSSKLGSFSWYGEQCSCACWVTPAFQIHKNRVDEVKQMQIPGLQKGSG
ncbi:dual specificity protein phosphatase 12 [Latimeria chalumnae]|uniref:Dual specificity protein phosphatase 12 n=1 Tax=Latimeria chalumnae TaxID=7897 RepID=H3AF95_LATCH|nr:PREDICTED: dual specificity protein phosphatase 12 [Latimeria chalumnae]|eukprot:XP_005994121.1 PREDICTED: dual specificity protein phosphatase 12 [Latimeria chalumnae]